jgi:hypothetical protein
MQNALRSLLAFEGVPKKAWRSSAAFAKPAAAK